MSPFLIAVLGLAIDGSQMYAQRQMAQAAADAAAQAGALSIFNGTNTTGYTFGTGSNPASHQCTTTDGITPCVYARDNGFGATAADTVTLSYPAAVSGVNLSSATVPAITVTVQRILQNGMIRIVGGGATSSITAKATAALIGSVSPYSIIALGTGPDTFLASNGGSVLLNGGAIAVDSGNATAVAICGASVVSKAWSIAQGGGYDTSNNCTAPQPTPTTGYVADPFASLPWPGPTSPCDHINYNNNSNGNGGATLPPLTPGIYCGGISISNNDTATFTPGIYIINGGGIHLGAAGSITGSGVTFFLTGTNSSFGSVEIDNGQHVTFSAPTYGTYQGVLFFQDGRIPTTPNPLASATFAGGATMNLTGSLYFPSTTVSYSNGSSSAGNVAIVANKVLFQGGATFNYDPTGQQTGLLSKSVALVQ